MPVALTLPLVVPTVDLGVLTTRHPKSSVTTNVCATERKPTADRPETLPDFGPYTFPHRNAFPTRRTQPLVAGAVPLEWNVTRRLWVSIRRSMFHSALKSMQEPNRACYVI